MICCKVFATMSDRFGTLAFINLGIVVKHDNFQAVLNCFIALMLYETSCIIAILTL